MTKRVLIIGGYGNFGSYIAKSLAKEDLVVIIAGRSEKKCRQFIKLINNSRHPLEYSVFDISETLPLSEIMPDIVIHTSGPFQEQDYHVATACIEAGCHYIDLSDGREFVSQIGKLDTLAKKAGVSVISGASSVPCLSSAIIDHYIVDFADLRKVEYAISTAQQTNRGYATTASILGYTGKNIKTLIDGNDVDVYGWQDLHLHKFPQFGYRLLSNCEIPDLELFPKFYPDLKTIRFSAGTEIKILHLGLWLLSWLVRFGFISSLRPAAKLFHKTAKLFDRVGSSNSAFYMRLSGNGTNGSIKTQKIYILAKSGDGPFIPCVPAIFLARKISQNQHVPVGAMPCIKLIDFADYVRELEGLDIELIYE